MALPEGDVASNRIVTESYFDSVTTLHPSSVIRVVNELLRKEKETFLADEGKEEVAYASVELLSISFDLGIGIRGVQTS
jgi:hypothetical protein